jgi:hypothetical protein
VLSGLSTQAADIELPQPLDLTVCDTATVVPALRLAPEVKHDRLTERRRSGVFKIKLDDAEAIVDLVLEGLIEANEMDRFVAVLKLATLKLKGREIKIKADLRTFRPAAPEVAEMIRGVQEFGIHSGGKRGPEIVESDEVALQLNRVARASGTDRIPRRFWDEDSAREWLIHGDAERSSST